MTEEQREQAGGLLHQVVEVWWDDTTSIAEWQDADEVRQLATNRVWQVRQVGWVVYEDHDCLVLAARVTPDWKHMGLTERIPLRAVVQITVLGP